MKRKKNKLPISKKYYYIHQIKEYNTVKKKHGVRYAKKWFEAKYGR